ncbi:MAG: DUF84 family protein [Promethearchaeota archaeon]
MKKKFVVAIGTKNRAKIFAVKNAFSILFPKDELEVYDYGVDSGVGPQPIGIDTIITGAKNRASKALTNYFDLNRKDPKQPKNERDNSSVIKRIYLGIGIESGLVPLEELKTGYMDMQFCAIYNEFGEFSLGCGSGFEYPPLIINPVLNGSKKEIGDVMEEITRIKNVKEKGGAIGFLTDGIVERSDILRNAVIMALIPYRSPELYSNFKINSQLKK